MTRWLRSKPAAATYSQTERFSPAARSKEFRLVLVHSGPYLLQQIGEKLGRYRGEQVVGRVYLEIGLPLATAFEAALADVTAFDFNCEGQP